MVLLLVRSNGPKQQPQHGIHGDVEQPVYHGPEQHAEHPSRIDDDQAELDELLEHHGVPLGHREQVPRTHDLQVLLDLRRFGFGLGLSLADVSAPLLPSLTALRRRRLVRSGRLNRRHGAGAMVVCSSMTVVASIRTPIWSSVPSALSCRTNRPSDPGMTTVFCATACLVPSLRYVPPTCQASKPPSVLAEPTPSPS